MEQFEKEGTGKKEVHGTGKRPYTSPTLTKHGDVEEITNALRRAGVKSTKGSIFDDE
jgi:hypothetical protein